MQDIINYNTQLVNVHFFKKKLRNKYKHTINLYKHFEIFFTIAEEQKLSEEQIQQYLINANDEITFLYCSSLQSHIARSNKLYQKYFPLMLNKLSKNIEYLYICLFDANYWYFMCPVLYCASSYRDISQLKKSRHLVLIEAYLEKLFNDCGYELYNKCKRGYNKMLLFFVLFQEYFTPEMINTFIHSMHKKLLYKNSNKESVMYYLNSSYVRIDVNNNQWNALKLLLQL